MKSDPLWRKSLLILSSLIIVFLILELIARISLSNYAPVLLRDGIYVNALPLVTGLMPPSLDGQPQGAPLPREKAAGEIRVFVFGESSIAGQVLDINASAPTMLYDLLAKAYPGRNIRVINMGRTASICANVYYYLLYTRIYRPDIVIFYMGMNDGPKMPGEECWVVSHPSLHLIQRFLVERSWLFWTIRAHGPRLIWAMKSSRNVFKKSDGWECPKDPLFEWAEVLISLAQSMGAHVIVTTPLHSAVAGLEPECYSSAAVTEQCRSMTDEYKQMLRCRLTKGCDFIGMLKNPLTPHDKRKLSMEDDQLGTKAEAWHAAATRHQADFVDFVSIMKKVSPYGILADKYFTDEVHLSPEGYCFLAKSWLEHIRAYWDGGKPQEPAPPTREEVQRYYKDAKTSGMSIFFHYLNRGWYLTSVPGLEMISTHCPGGKCDEQAEVALGWLRRKVGLDADVPRKLWEKVDAFRPEDRLR